MDWKAEKNLEADSTIPGDYSMICFGVVFG